MTEEYIGDLKFCAICQKEGKKSIIKVVYVKELDFKHDSFHDEDGRRHSHNISKDIIYYRCSNSHTWNKDDLNTLKCWCGWPDEGEYSKRLETNEE